MLEHGQKIQKIVFLAIKTFFLLLLFEILHQTPLSHLPADKKKYIGLGPFIWLI